jgi:hypothetical protein
MRARRDKGPGGGEGPDVGERRGASQRGEGPAGGGKGASRICRGLPEVGGLSVGRWPKLS